MTDITSSEITSGKLTFNVSREVASELARDYLSGCYDDYVFYCRSVDTSNGVVSSEYVLLTGEIDRAPNAYVITDSYVRQFVVSVSGSDAPVVEGRAYDGPEEVVLIDTDQQIIYSSVGSDPRLVEGGVYYAHSLLLLAAIAFAVLGFAAIWRRLY